MSRGGPDRAAAPRTSPVTRGAAITGWGCALAPEVVTNHDLAGRLDTSDQWIVERTGIRERRIGGTTAGLAEAAGRAALERAGLAPNEVGLLILATTTPDQVMPATAVDVAWRLGVQAPAFDLNAACSGFTYSLVTAHAMIATGVDHALVIGAEVLSRITDQDDRSTVVLFGDGAGAVVLEVLAGDDRVLAWDQGCDGSAGHILFCSRRGTLEMQGREVYRRAVRTTLESIQAVLERAKLRPDQIDLFVPHGANLRIIEGINQRLGIPMERTAVLLDQTGNTSAASIPMALATAADEGRLAPDDNVLLSGFGAGMTWSSVILRWGQ